jgi:hypothetical protein
MKEIKNYIEQFRNWLKEDEKAKRWREDRERRIKWYKEKLSLEKIDSLTENDFSEMIKKLWASDVWKNKDYKVRSLIKDNGFEKIKQGLKKLLYGKEEIEKRWDEFKKSIKGLGPSSMSEILAFFNPEEYPLINQKTYKVLPRLGISIDIVRNGKEYKKAKEKVEKVKVALIENGFENVNFVFTDLFIAFLFYEVFDLAYVGRKGEILPPKIKEKPKKEIKFEPIRISSHETAEAILLSLGNLLGFDTYTPDKGRIVKGKPLGDIATLQELPYFGSEKIMESAQNIDVVWIKDEWPEYFFEVEHSTGITPGLLRIYRVAGKLSAKCFIIGPAEMLPKFKREIEKPPFDKIKERYKFKSYEELEEMYLATKKFIEISRDFLEKW